MQRFVPHLLIILLTSLLAACSNGPDADLVEYVKKVKSGELSRTESIPKAKTYSFFSYEDDKLRDPFQAAVISPKQNGHKTSGISPDKTRKREPLENFPLDTLRMVGVLTVNNQRWAMVQTSDGTVYRVTIGNYMGQNHGKITKITASSIQLVEIVSDGLGGWTERDATLALTTGQ